MGPNEFRRKQQAVQHRNIMAKTGGKMEGRNPFRIGSVRTEGDIPDWVWREALPDLRIEFRTIQHAGDVPDEGKNVDALKAPPREKWHKSFVAILSQFDGRAQPTVVA